MQKHAMTEIELQPAADVSSLFEPVCRGRVISLTAPGQNFAHDLWAVQGIRCFISILHPSAAALHIACKYHRCACGIALQIIMPA